MFCLLLVIYHQGIIIIDINPTALIGSSRSLKHFAGQNCWLSFPLAVTGYFSPVRTEE